MKLSNNESEALLQTLKKRFEKNMHRHEDCTWHDVEARLLENPKKLWSLSEMERTGGEPDVIGKDVQTNAFIFCDCSPESPAGRRSLCYDHEAQVSRKENQPSNNVLDIAQSMGIELLDEETYKSLQKLGTFDTKTSSWIFTPAEVRALGGALFADHRYGRTFVYHNGAQSYYAARGFRGILKVSTQVKKNGG